MPYGPRAGAPTYALCASLSSSCAIGSTFRILDVHCRAFEVPHALSPTKTRPRRHVGRTHLHGRNIVISLSFILLATSLEELTAARRQSLERLRELSAHPSAINDVNWGRKSQHLRYSYVRGDIRRPHIGLTDDPDPCFSRWPIPRILNKPMCSHCPVFRPFVGNSLKPRALEPVWSASALNSLQHASLEVVTLTNMGACLVVIVTKTPLVLSRFRCSSKTDNSHFMERNATVTLNSF